MKNLAENDLIEILYVLDSLHNCNESTGCIMITDTPTNSHQTITMIDQTHVLASLPTKGAATRLVQMQTQSQGRLRIDCVGKSVVSGLSVLIRRVKSANSFPPVELERLLDSLASIIKRQVTTSHAKQPWFSYSAEVTIAIIWGYPWPPKLHKKVIKVMVEMEKFEETLIKQLLTPWIKLFNQTKLDKSEVNTWYGLVEVSRVARQVIGSNLEVVVTFLDTNLAELLKDDQSWTVDRQQWLLLLLKVALQMFQQLPTEVRLLVYGTENSGVSHFPSLVSYIIRLLASEGIPSHCMPLAGTATAFLICLCPDPCSGAEIFRDIFLNLGSSTVIRLGSVRIKPSPLNASNATADNTLTTFGHLSLLTGFLPCVTSEMLSHRVVIKEVSQMCFALWLFDLVVDLCMVPEHQYHSFRLLTAWYQQMARHSVHFQAGETGIFCMGSPVVTSTLDLVWTHMDSPVDGINELVIAAFHAMLKLHFAEQDLAIKHTCQDEALVDSKHLKQPGRSIHQSPLLNEVLAQALRLPWTVKGKHHLVAVIVSYMDVELLMEREINMLDELLKCCSTNYLGPPSTVLYRALLCRLTENSSLDGFKKYLLPWIVKGLMAESVLLRQNVSQYWLVATLKQNKDTYPLIFEYIRNLEREQTADSATDLLASNHMVHALVAVMMAGKAQQLLTDGWLEVVQWALRHQDADIRQDAFAILCVSQKKAEPLNTAELDLLRMCLPDNMTCDNAPFRQRMQASLRALLIRLRSSAISSLRTKPGSTDNLSTTVIDALDFIDWFWTLLMNSLSPCASYQRLKSGLDWALVVLDTFSYQPYRHQRKGSTPDTVRYLLELAALRGQWDFYSPTNARLILTCLFHGTDEIREMTASIFLDYFPWPLQLSQFDATMHGDSAKVPRVLSSGQLGVEYHLLQTGLRLCNSAKPHQSESGALLIKIIFQKIVLENKQEINFQLLDGNAMSEVESNAENEEDVEAPAHHFIHHLVRLLENYLVNTQEDTLHGAKTTPMHGLLISLRRCLSEAGLTFVCPALWVPVMKRLLCCISEVMDIVMNVLGGKLHDDGTAPSFEEIGLAISATIAESAGDLAAHNTLLTTDHRLLMTWAWVNIKESSLLLGSLVESLPLTTDAATGVLSTEQLISIGQIFLKVLLQCRHRGAIEGCNMGLARFCEQLLLSSDQQLHSIPKQLLSQVFSQIQRSDVALSVTRRSAGLPLIITSIITSESKTRQDLLLCHVIETLLSLAETPVAEADQRADLPAVHALNMLMAVLKEAAVATAARRYLARALMIAVEGFASPHWAVHNAATQLFGILVNRMLGQKRTHEDHVDLMTMPEFLAHYPPLEAFLLRHLEHGAADQKAAGRGNLRLQPTTFPVLSILARLSAGNTLHGQYQLSVTKFNTALTQLLGCPVHAVRELAARSLGSLTVSEQCLHTLCHVLKELPSDYSHMIQHNRLHGDVVLCSYLQKNLPSSTTQDDLRNVLKILSSKLWLASGSSSTIQACYINLLMDTVHLLSLHKIIGIPESISACLHWQMEGVLQVKDASVTAKVGRDQLVQSLVNWFLSPESTTERQFINRVKQCIVCPDADVVLTTLTCTATKIKISPFSDEGWSEIKVAVGQVALSSPHCSIGAAALELLAHSGTQLDFLETNPVVQWDHLVQLINREMNSRQTGPALFLTATLVNVDVQKRDTTRLTLWGDLLTNCCGPQNAECLHLHAAKALTTLAPSVAAYMAEQTADQTMDILVLRMFEAGVRLLVSEHVAVRQEAAYFVSVLKAGIDEVGNLNNAKPKTRPLHTALALKVLCEETFITLGSNPALFPPVINLVRKVRPSLSHLVEQEAKQYAEVLFEAEDANYYKEDAMIAHTVWSTLLKNVKVGAVDEKFMQDCLKSIMIDMEQALTSLHNFCSVSGPVNVSCGSYVYEALWIDLLFISLMVNLPCALQYQTQELYELLTSYSEIPFLHPHLQKRTQNLRREIQSL